MSNVLDLLLRADMTKVKKPIREVEIKRLSEICGQKIIFTCQGLSLDEVEHVKELAVKGSEVNMRDTIIFTAIEGVKDPMIKSKDLLSKYNAVTPKELLAKGDFLLPGEITELYYVIQELSGYGDSAVEEVKNS